MVTIRAGFKPKALEATNRVSQLDPLRQGSIQRIREAIARTGSILIKNSPPNGVSQITNKPLPGFVNSADAGDQSVLGGPSVQNQPDEVVSVSEPQAYPPRRGSINRFKEAAASVLVRTGSILNLNKSSSPVSESQHVINDNKPLSGFVNSVFAGGQSVGGGLSVPNQPKPHDFVGTHISLVINSFLIVMFFTNAELITLRI